MKSTKQKLDEIVDWLGDGYGYYRLKSFMEGIDKGVSPQEAKFRDNFNMVHRCFELVLNNPGDK